MSYKKIIIISSIILPIILIVWFFKLANNYPRKIDLKYRPDYFGVTFSKKTAAVLNLDWRELYLAILDDLQVKQIRLPIYWDEIEKADGQYDFSDYDYLLTEGAKRNVKFIASIGWRLPRWPECHTPTWLKGSETEKIKNETLKMLEVTVNHYKDQTAIVYWQVENEPLLNVFGECPPADENFLRKETALVRSLDSRPIIISSSGELGSWKKEAQLADIFGATLYRVVWGKYTGYIRYPMPSWYYRLKAILAGVKPGRRFILELQAEPWAPTGLFSDLTPAQINKSFDLQQFKANTQYAINVNFDKAYLWGVEWWYSELKQGHGEYWALAKTLFK